MGAALAGAGALAYASFAERNWFTLRQAEVPVLAPGTSPIRVLHISDVHLTPGRKRLMAWLTDLDRLEPDLVVNTGDSIAHPEAVGYLVDSLGPLLDRPGQVGTDPLRHDGGRWGQEALPEHLEAGPDVQHLLQV